MPRCTATVRHSESVSSGGGLHPPKIKASEYPTRATRVLVVVNTTLFLEMNFHVADHAANMIVRHLIIDLFTVSL